MDSVIDKKIKVPLHYQIYLDLLKKIQSGLLRPGERIPSEPELERIYGVSRVTVSRVLGEFVRLGWIKTGYRTVQILRRRALEQLVERGSQEAH